jgi:hypothetical protein
MLSIFFNPPLIFMLCYISYDLLRGAFLYYTVHVSVTVHFIHITNVTYLLFIITVYFYIVYHYRLFL